MARDLSPPSVEDWTRKVNRVWKPTGPLQIRLRSGGGFIFVAELEPGLTLHLGVQAVGIDMCALWQGKECVLWDSLVGFCSMLSTAPMSPEQSAFDLAMRPLIRRNCFALGCEVEATEEEKRAWREWMGQGTGSDEASGVS